LERIIRMRYLVPAAAILGAVISYTLGLEMQPSPTGLLWGIVASGVLASFACVWLWRANGNHTIARALIVCVSFTVALCVCEAIAFYRTHVRLTVVGPYAPHDLWCRPVHQSEIPEIENLLSALRRDFFEYSEDVFRMVDRINEFLRSRGSKGRGFPLSRSENGSISWRGWVPKGEVLVASVCGKCGGYAEVIRVDDDMIVHMREECCIDVYSP